MYGLFSIFDLGTLPWLLAGIPIGLIFGLLPGLSGLSALALLMPFVFGMDPGPALAFLLAAHAVIYTGGSVTAVLMNIPGAPPNAAAMIDGFPMTQQGLGGRAVGNAVTSSIIGGIFGGLVLIGLVFLVRPIVMSFGLPEYFFLSLLGISFIAVLGRESAVKGVISGTIGVFLSLVGMHTLTGIPRFTFGSIMLMDGFGVVPVALGLFAMPEVLKLFFSSGSIAQVEKSNLNVGVKAVLEGIKDIPRNFRLVLQSSVIGTVIGIIPGVGGDTAPFVAYGIAKRTSKNPEKFGYGSIEGVIAPESANNAKEGGSLLPTLAFGIPGSSAMALLMGAFLLVGIKPGPLFLQEHTALAFSLASTVIFANICGGSLLLLLGGHLAKLTFIRGNLLAPIVLTLIVVGGYATRGALWDVGLVVAFGAMGWAMLVYDYNRPALLLGFVLGGMAERYFGLSLQTYGWLFFARPISLTLLAATIFVLFSGQIRTGITGVRRKIGR